MCQGAWRVAHFVDSGWKGEVGQVDVCVVLVGANVVSADRELEGILDWLDLSDYVAVPCQMVFQGGCLAEGESGEDAEIVHELVCWLYSDGVTLGEEVGDGCA
jgi:hypothetical protein